MCMEKTAQVNPHVAAADDHNSKTQRGCIELKCTCKKWKIEELLCCKGHQNCRTRIKTTLNQNQAATTTVPWEHIVWGIDSKSKCLKNGNNTIGTQQQDASVTPPRHHWQTSKKPPSTIPPRHQLNTTETPARRQRDTGTHPASRRQPGTRQRRPHLELTTPSYRYWENSLFLAFPCICTNVDCLRPLQSSRAWKRRA